jgi:hypothetical protein
MAGQVMRFCFGLVQTEATTSQAMYQQLDPCFVGLIFSVFNPSADGAGGQVGRLRCPSSTFMRAFCMLRDMAAISAACVAM